jgi:hypothetical protein
MNHINEAFSYFNPNIDNCESESAKYHHHIVCLIIDSAVVQLYLLIISVHKIRCDVGGWKF